MTASEAGAPPAHDVRAPVAAFGGAAMAGPVRSALEELLLALADDEFVIGFMDSEWTGIAPLLEEDVAMSSLAQDELGHARALYQLLGDLTGRDADVIAFDRPVEAFRHARLLDGGRGDWAATIARRFLYDTADSVRLEALSRSAWPPLAELATKIRREETYHLLHAEAWLLRLADGGAEARGRLLRALAALAPMAWTVLAALPGEGALVEAGVLPVASQELDRRWRERVDPVIASAGLPALPGPPDGVASPGDAAARDGARAGHGQAFRWLHGEFTAVRSLDPEATW
jgi:ring-1,2-phenylacetyl-CoA epoxidase subunit PaaC